MKFTTLLATTATLALTLSTTAGDQCNLEEVKGVLAANATTGLDKCQEEIGFDLFQLEDFPPVNLTKALNKNRGCVNSLNMVNNQAQKYLMCNITFGPGANDTTTLGAFLKNILRGRTGNLTEDAMYSWSESESASESGSDEEEEGSESSSSSKSGSKTGSSSGSTTTMAVAAATASMVAITMALV